MPTKRPVAEALARANAEPLEELPEFPMPEPLDLSTHVNGTEACGATAPWGVHCTSEVEHRGSHSWQDKDRFPPTQATASQTTIPALGIEATFTLAGGSATAGTAIVPLKDAEEVFGPPEVELPGMPRAKERKPKMTSTLTAPVSMTATLKRLGYKSGTQADPDAYVEMVIRTNDLSVGAELGWQTGKTLTVTMQPEQPRLPTGADEQD